MIDEKIKPEAIYDKHINFLIGSGASHGLFPTLAVTLGKDKGETHSFESITNEIEAISEGRKENFLALMFMHYYKNCIKPIMNFDMAKVSDEEKVIIQNYENFLTNILAILNRRSASHNPMCNLFTTNYDGCLALTADKLLQDGFLNFFINDGSCGFREKTLGAKNFNLQMRQAGTFSKQSHPIPQINLIHLHGSAYWKKRSGGIIVDYTSTHEEIPINEISLDPFSKLLNDGSKNIEDLINHASTLGKDFAKEAKEFLNKYNELPIVNPTKWKFHETVFEEHYYQMLRSLSYELEREDSTLITFGFSFADQHILNLVKRALSNLSLQVFICCYDENDLHSLQEKFKGHNNVSFIKGNDGNLNFAKFNSEAFSLSATNSGNVVNEQ